MYKLIISIMCVVLAALVWSFGRYVIYNDHSTLPVSALSNPDLGRTSYESRPVVYLISYADGSDVFFKNQQGLAASAINRGVDYILNYRKSHLDSEFFKQYQAILSHKIGAGFWLWKPWIILHTLKTVPEGSYVIYCDSGLVLSDSVLPAIEKMKGKDVMLVRYDPLVEGYPIEIAKRDIFVRLKCDDPVCWDGDHVWAAFLVLRNTQKSRDFVGQWLDLCCDGHLLMNDPSSAKPHPRQRNHQHDEAILSVLYNTKKRDGDNYFTLLPVSDLNQFSFWHHRHEGREYDSFSYKSSYHRVRGIERDWILNAPWMQKLREILLSP